MSAQSPSPIVVIDDDFEHLAYVSALLTRTNYHCLAFTSARDALTYLKRSPVDLVITDIFMPEMDGFEMLRAIREAHHNVAVITLSGEGRLTRDFYLKCATELGAVATFRKPLEPDAFCAAVARLAGVSGALSARMKKKSQTVMAMAPDS